MILLLFDMGLPMIIPSMTLMALALVPMVFIESYFVGARLNTGVKKVVGPVAWANLVSTIIGIPVTWFLLVVLEFASVGVLGAIMDRNPWTDLFSLTLGAPWVAPGHHNEKLIILGAMLFLLIPYGLASWAIEYLVIKSMLAKIQDVSPPSKSLKLAVGKANLISYCLLAVFVTLYWGFTLFS